MKVLSLFDGLGGARQALKNLEIVPEVYVASEIDKFAIKIAKKNHPDIIHIGDINDINYTLNIKYGLFDLIIGGFPCIDLSIAKKNRQGLKGTQSGLFWKMANIIKEFRPKYFLVENVASMSKTNQAIITQVLGVEPILINSALLTAQNRRRLYWTNIPEVTQPKDKHIYLKDILEEGFTERGKSLCITGSYRKSTVESYFYKSDRQLIFDKPVKVAHIGSGTQGQRIYTVDGKSITLSGNGGGQGAKTGLYEISIKQTARGYNKGGTKALNGKTPTITSNSWQHNNHLKITSYHAPHYAKIKKSNKPLIVSERGRRLVPNGTQRDDKNGEVYRGLEVVLDKKTGCLSTVLKDNLVVLKSIIRKLHPLECERLQGYEDQYTKGVSNTQRYKMLGNSFTCPVIEHILSFIK